MLKHAALLALFLAGSTCNAFALDSGFWVVVGNMQQDETNPAVSSRIHAKIGRCGFQAFNDFSSKFGFVPGYIVFVLGAYASRAEAQAVLQQARRCVPDAYIKRGAYAGE